MLWAVVLWRTLWTCATTGHHPMVHMAGESSAGSRWHDGAARPRVRSRAVR